MSLPVIDAISAWASGNVSEEVVDAMARTLKDVPLVLKAIEAARNESKIFQK